MAKSTETRHKVTVSDLIDQCNNAVEKMSVNNPNRTLVFNCAFAMRQLVDRLAKYEAEGMVPGPEEPQ